MKPFPKLDGCEFYLVGGCVRDIALKRPNKDRDFVVLTQLPFDKLVESIKAKPGCEVFQAKKEFLTIRCKMDGEVLDIAYPRSEHGHTDARHPDEVKQLTSLEEDASRRDFTMNSMYMDTNGKPIDYYHGLLDINNKIIKAVGEPEERLNEDHLRILRAIRFSAQLGFVIDPFTYIAMQKVAPKLINTDFNRVRDELNNSLKANPEITIYYLKQLNLFTVLRSHGLTFQLSSKSG